MSETAQRLPPAAADLLREHGYRPGRVLGSGMEGVVVGLAGGRVAKSWHRRTAAELAVLQGFYAAVDLPGVRTPRILDILASDGFALSVEDELVGRPMRVTMTAESSFVEDDHVECLVAVLAALSAAPTSPALRCLSVLDGEGPFDDDRSFGAALADLVERRTRRFRDPLASRLPDLDRLVSATTDLLRTREQAPRRLVHGDLIPANLLVDDDGSAAAVLDFGFLTTTGDPAFDAAVTAAVYDMYGARGRLNERVLDDAFADRLGHARRDLELYRAAYALVASNCFSVSGSDGHFAWCVAVLQRASVRDALAL